MKVTFLGTGTSGGIPLPGCRCRVCTSPDPRDSRLRSSILVETGDRTILIDASPDLRTQLLTHNISNIDTILLTHSHRDHIAGLDELASLYYLRKSPFELLAEETTLRTVRHVHFYIFGEKPYPGAPRFAIKTIKPFESIWCGRVEVLPLRVFHARMPIVGFLIGGRLAYITDASCLPASAIEKVKGCAVLVINALRREPHPAHLNLAQALSVIKSIKPEQAYLIHLSHQMGTHEEVSRMLPGGVALAHDGLYIEI